MHLGLFETVADLASGEEILRRRRYGLIIVRNRRLHAVKLRPWPKVISIPEIGAFGSWRHKFMRGDECRLYYNQPHRHSNFLALRYFVTTVGTSMATVNVALAALDEIARIKGTDALLCDAANVRISDRVMRRYGWDSHKPQRWHRNFIKRYYGVYPALPAAMRKTLYGAAPSGASPPNPAVGEHPVTQLLRESRYVKSRLAEESARMPTDSTVEACLNCMDEFDHFDDVVLTAIRTPHAGLPSATPRRLPEEQTR